MPSAASSTASAARKASGRSTNASARTSAKAAAKTSTSTAAKTAAKKRDGRARNSAPESEAPSRKTALRRTAADQTEQADSAATGHAPAAARVLWKGAINFGLVHVPVALYSAVASGGLDFDWLDRRKLDPVGYKRVNKKTGEEVPSKEIVKGLEIDEGRYVVLSPDEIRAALPKATQSIDIEAFVAADEIPLVYLERPYDVAPIHRGERLYALLREALARSSRAGVARVVIQTRQHLAVVRQ